MSTSGWATLLQSDWVRGSGEMLHGKGILKKKKTRLVEREFAKKFVLQRY